MHGPLSVKFVYKSFLTVVLTLYQKIGLRLNMGFILKLGKTAAESLSLLREVSRRQCYLTHTLTQSSEEIWRLGLLWSSASSNGNAFGCDNT